MSARRLVTFGVLAAAVAFGFRAVAFPRGGGSSAVLVDAGQGEFVPLTNKEIAAVLLAEYDAANFGGFFSTNGIITLGDLMAVFQIESRFDPAAIKYNDGGAGNHAYGIGQMLGTTAGDLGISNPSDLFNIEIGVLATMNYFKWMYDFLSPRLQRPPTAREWIGAYNIGIGNALNGVLPLAYLTKHAAAKTLL